MESWVKKVYKKFDAPELTYESFTCERYAGQVGYDSYKIWDMSLGKFNDNKDTTFCGSEDLMNSERFLVLGKMYGEKLPIRSRTDSIAVLAVDKEDDTVFWFHWWIYRTTEINMRLAKKNKK